MKDLSMHIMDIVQNSIRAKAREVVVNIVIEGKHCCVEIGDDGVGMDEVMVQRVSDPFFTSRKTRRVGLGIPLIKQNAEQTGGRFELSSKLGVGTQLTACFIMDHWDCPPWGDLPATIAMIMCGNPELEVSFSCGCAAGTFSLQTSEVKEILGDIDMRLPKVVSFLKEMIRENLIELKIEL